MSTSDEPVDEIAAVRKDIEQTRAELAETVDALSDKLNVKKQASDKLAEVKASASDKVDTAKTTASEHPREFAVAGGVVAALVALVVVVRWRRSR